MTYTSEAYEADRPKEFSGRVGNCYGLAAKYVLAHPDTELVHGSIQGMGFPRNDHAWVVLPDGKRHDPVSDLTLPAEVWERFANAIENVRYTRDETRSLVLSSKHWGPWDDEG